MIDKILSSIVVAALNNNVECISFCLKILCIYHNGRLFNLNYLLDYLEKPYLEKKNFFWNILQVPFLDIKISVLSLGKNY